MRLLIIGHTAHYFRDRDLVGWGPTVEEINWLARAFDQVIHLTFLHQVPAPASALPYDSDNIEVVALFPSGGLTFKSKLQIVTQSPNYINQIRKYSALADVIHVRCPGSLGMYGMLVTSFIDEKKVWIKYAGDWDAKIHQMAISHILQREWLRRGFSNAPVTVNNHCQNQPNHVFSFLNPSLSLVDLVFFHDRKLKKYLSPPYRILFIGRASRRKGLPAVFRIFERLMDICPGQFIFDIVGDGEACYAYKQYIQKKGLGDSIRFHGWIPHSEVKELLIPAHFILHPSMSEGWPKVLSEAMAFGVVPLASNILTISQIFSLVGSGISFPVNDDNGYIKAILTFLDEPSRWLEMSKAGIDSAPQFTYERYLIALDHMFKRFYGESPMKHTFINQINSKMIELSDSPLNRFWSV